MMTARGLNASLFQCQPTEIPLPSKTSGGRQPLLEALTKREPEILGLLARHLTNQEIADKLYISPRTVKSHTKNIYGKLGASSRREAVAKAMDFVYFNGEIW